MTFAEVLDRRRTDLGFSIAETHRRVKAAGGKITSEGVRSILTGRTMPRAGTLNPLFDALRFPGRERLRLLALAALPPSIALPLAA